MIGFTTFSFSYADVLIGEKHGAKLEGKTGLFGGMLLILLATFEAIAKRLCIFVEWATRTRVRLRAAARARRIVSHD